MHKLTEKEDGESFNFGVEDESEIGEVFVEKEQ